MNIDRATTFLQDFLFQGLLKTLNFNTFKALLFQLTIIIISIPMAQFPSNIVKI